MIYLVPSNNFSGSSGFVLFVHFIQVLVAVSEFLDDELLELYHISDIEESLDLVQYHYTELICYTTITIPTHHHQQSSQELAAHRLAHVLIHLQIVVRRLGWRASSHAGLGLRQRTGAWMEKN